MFLPLLTCTLADAAEANANSIKLHTYGMCGMVYAYLAEHPEVETLKQAFDGFCKAVPNAEISRIRAQERNRFMKVLKIL